MKIKKISIDVSRIARGHQFVAGLTARQRVIPSKKVYKRNQKHNRPE